MRENQENGLNKIKSAGIRLVIQAIVMMGVAGSGKTTIGQMLARRLGWEFRDADDDHPPANVEKMRAGIALNDADRAPWLAILAGRIRKAIEHDDPIVIACSALKQAYRDQLADGFAQVRFVYLKGTQQEIQERMAARLHFMPVTLLDSQFATLEEPADALSLHIAHRPDELVQMVVDTLALTPRS